MPDVNSTFKVYITNEPVFKVYVNNGAKGDTGEGVPAGGVANQYLVKLSGDNFDTAWQTIDSTQVAYGDGTVSEGLDNRYTKGETDLLLDDKSDVGHIHDDRYFTETEVGVLLSGKSDTSHTHDGRYYTETETDALLSGKSDTTHNHDLTYAPIVHNHDDLYYTDDEVDTLLLSKSDTTHTHDDRYYTETETNTLLSNKSDKLSATNLVTNGNFNTDLTGWASGVGGVWESGRLKLFSTATAYRSQAISFVSGRKYYLAFKCEIMRYVSGTMSLQIRNGATLVYGLDANTSLGLKSTSAVYSLANVADNIFIGNLNTGNADVYYDDVFIIDLTSTFGIGNEPTATEMDTLLAKFPNSWFNGTNYLADLSEITKLGNSVIQNATEANAKIEASSTGAVITRNVNDANVALIVNQVQGTADILELKNAGNSRAKVLYDGSFYTTDGTYRSQYGLRNSTSVNNAYVNVASTGTLISRNIADANPALKVNQANASSTGKILDLQFNGTSKVTVDINGIVVAPYFKSQYFQNPSSSTNAAINLSATGAEITHNNADAFPALRVNQINASSTGNIAEFQFAGTTKLAIDKNGLIPQEAWTNVTFENSHAAEAGYPVAYMKDKMGFVHLKGRVVSTGATTIFTLPAGYRPLTTSSFFGCRAGYGTLAVLEIAGTGAATLITAVNGNKYDLTGITFLAEQ